MGWVKLCKWGDCEQVDVIIPASHSSTGKDKPKTVPIDSCIAPIVIALNEAGVPTLASCCGHERGAGSIMLVDGRELVVAQSREDANTMIGAVFAKNGWVWKDNGWKQNESEPTGSGK